jgi:hypothetical protein
MYSGSGTKLAWLNTMCEEEAFTGSIRCPTLETVTIDFWAPDQWGVTIGSWVSEIEFHL